MASLIILLGPSGAGKSVQAERLSERHGWVHISTGQLIREDNDPWVMSQANIGHLAPTDYVNGLLFRSLQSHMGRDIILDGYPRMLDEAEWLQGRLSDLKLDLKRVVFLNIPREESVERILKRGRKDDNKQALEERWDYFNEQVEVVIDHFKKQDLLTEVDGVGSLEEVTARIEKVL